MAAPSRSRRTRSGGSNSSISLPASSRLDQARRNRRGGSIRNLTGLSCLVVDDEKEVGELIADVLKRAGFKVDVARSGEEALERLKKRLSR